MANAVKKGFHQERVNEKYFSQRISPKESKAILKLVKDSDTKKSLRWAWERTELAYPKHARVVTAWCLAADMVMKMQDTIERDLLKSAIKKAAQHWGQVDKEVQPILACKEMEENEEDDDDDRDNDTDGQEEDGEDEDEDPSYKSSEEEDEEEEDEEEGEEEEENEENETVDLVQTDDEVEVEMEVMKPKRACLPSKCVTPTVAAKIKSTVIASPPNKRGRKPAIVAKDYIVPEEKLVLLESGPSIPERFAVFDISTR